MGFRYGVELEVELAALFAPPAGQIDIGDAQNEGASSNIPRADHTHAFPAPTGPPPGLAGASAAGASGRPATQDHTHAHTAAHHDAGGHADLTGIFAGTGHTHPALAGFDTQGLFSARPVAGNQGATYYATDLDRWYRDDGTAWRAIGGPLVFNVRDYGALGDGLTDDTAAIQAALNAATAVVEADGRAQQRPTVLFPAGVFRITAPFTTITERGLRIVGQGRLNTQISYDALTNAPIFDIGTFSTAPADLFTGPQDVEFRGLRIRATSPGAIGARIAQGIRCSGGGGLILDDVAVLGFAYGINSPYGGDFNLFRNVDAEYCDVGVYVGPGGQQFYADRLNCFACEEGLVLDRFRQAHLTLPIFNSCGEAGVVIEAVTDTSTRQLTSFPTGGTSYQSKLVLDSPWFEGNAGALGDDYIPTHFVKADVAGSDAYRDVVINDPKIVAGSATKTTTSFVASVGALVNGLQRVTVARPVFSGAMTQWFTNPVSNWVLIDRRIESGFAAPALSAAIGTNVGAVLDGPLTANGEQRINVADLPFTHYWEQADDAHGISLKADINGVIALAFMTGGSWFTRLGFDVQNRRVMLDDPASASACQISRNGSMPSSGSWGAGSFVLNTAPVVSAGKVLLGWLRLTNGSGHVAGTDWTPLYCTTS